MNSPGGQRPLPETFIRRNIAKLAAILFWLLILTSYYLVLRTQNLTLESSVTLISNWLTLELWGPLLFILLYVVGPLFFFPATVLSLLGGFLFGPMGILYTVIGSNASAMVAFGIGRYFGKGILDRGEHRGIMQRYARRLRENSFQTVLIMHLIFLPYELVNYACGLLQISWKPFLAGTALGSIVATISIVMLGTSFGTVDELLAGDIHLDPITLAASLLLIVSSITLSRYLQKREAEEEPKI